MISTHILDTSLGSPAMDVMVTLERQDSANSWEKLSTESSNMDGRINFRNQVGTGVYRLSFSVDKYFQSKKQEHFFQIVEITFKIENTNRNYHVPLLLNPYGYTTYRGS